MEDKIQLRRDTLANWLKVDPILMDGELALVATDASKSTVYDSKKVGDGIHKFSELEMLGYDCLQELGDNQQFPMSQDAVLGEVNSLRESLFQTFEVAGTFVMADGTIASDPDRPFCRTDFINIKYADKITVLNGFGNEYCCTVAFYDKKKSFLSGIIRKTEGAQSFTILKKDFPDSAVYAMGTSYTTYKNKLFAAIVSNTQILDLMDPERVNYSYESFPSNFIKTAPDIRHYITESGWIGTGNVIHSDINCLYGYLPIPEKTRLLSLAGWADTLWISPWVTFLGTDDKVLSQVKYPDAPSIQCRIPSGATKVGISVLKKCLNTLRLEFRSEYPITTDVEQRITDVEQDFSPKYIHGIVTPIGVLYSYPDTETAPFCRTNYLWIRGSESIRILGAYSNQYVSAYSFYDKDKKVIENHPDEAGVIRRLDITLSAKDIPEGAYYMAVTSNFNYEDRRVIIKGAVAEIISEVISEVIPKPIVTSIANQSVTPDTILSVFDISEQLSGAGWVQRDGTVFDDSIWVNGKIGIPTGTKCLKLSGWGTEYGLAYLVFLNSQDTIISKVKLDSDYVECSIPSGATKVHLSVMKSRMDTFRFGFFYTESVSEIKDQIASIPVLKFNKLCCPDRYYAIVGKEFNLYYDSIIQGLDNGLYSPFGIYIDVQCPTLQNGANRIGIRRDRMWQIDGSLLTSSYVGDHKMWISAWNSFGDLIDKKEVTLTVNDNSQLSVAKRILCIGDSLTNNGPIVATCAQHFTDLGGTQPIFIGQRTTSGYKHEGYPGYTFGSFVNSGSTGYAYTIFDVPQGTTVSVNDKYSTNGTTFTVMDIRTEGLDEAIRLRCEGSSSVTIPPSTGTLTKVSGSHASDASINYTAVEREGGNPFWDVTTNATNFTAYRKKMGMGDSKFDIVVIMLGTNDSVGYIKPSMQASANNAIALVNKIFEDAGDYPTRVILQMPPLDANTISSWQVYRDSSGGKSGAKVSYQRNLWSLRGLLYTEFTKAQWSGKVYLGQASFGVDRYYGYPYTLKKSSSRITIEEAVHDNSVHPNASGYQQFGDGYYLQIKGLL